MKFFFTATESLFFFLQTFFSHFECPLTRLFSGQDEIRTSNLITSVTFVTFCDQRYVQQLSHLAD